MTKTLSVLAALVMVSGEVAAQSRTCEPRDIPYDDPAISLAILGAKRAGAGLIEIVYRQRGKISGDLFIRKVVDCTQPRMRNLGEGETLETLETSTKDPEYSRKWYPVRLDMKGTSSATYRAACQLLRP